MKLKSKFDAAWAYPTDLFTVNVSEWRHMHPVFREAKCCACGTCSLYCPTGCVEQRGEHFEASLDHCKGCGVCAQVCPVQAIRMVMEK